MGDNPYQAPREASGEPQQSRNSHKPHKAIFARIARKLPATVLMLALATVIGSFWCVDFYLKELRLEREGSLASERSPFVPLVMPGMFPWYVVGTLTSSWVLAWIAFAAGMAVVYGSIGLVIDFCRWVLFGDHSR